MSSSLCKTFGDGRGMHIAFALHARSCTPCTHHTRFMHGWHADFRKHLIAYSYRSPSVFPCAELQFSGLTHHQPPRCPLMKQDRWTAATETPLGNICPRMVGVEPSQWMSAATHWCSVLMIIVDSWSKITSFSLQCAFLSPLLDYNWLW